MRRVYKYPVPALNQTTALTLPKGAKFLSAGFQGSILYVWVEVDTEANSIEYRVGSFYTGRPVPGGLKFVDTVIELGGSSSPVYHVYAGVA